jgi:glycine/D-amino acid oxidase-like deaminating enzyme
MKATADVVVIGAGVIGCCVAGELAARGASVVVIEREHIGAGASGRNHGLLFRPEDPAVDPLYRFSLERYRELAAGSELDLALDPAPFGLAIVVTQGQQWVAAEREALVAAKAGCRVERLEEAELQAEEPALAPGHLGGFLIDDGLRVDPAALTLALALDARRSGAEVVTHTEVKQILAAGTGDGRSVRGVATDGGTVAAPAVVDAAGPWAAKLARSASADLPIGGIRGWILLTEARPGLMHHVVELAGWHLPAGDPGPRPPSVAHLAAGVVARRDVGTLVQQSRSGHLLLGGSRAASLAEHAEGPEVAAQIAGGAASLVPAIGTLALLSTWSGVRPTSPDGRALIGAVPGVAGLFVAGGHGGQGVSLGAGSGRLAAELVLGEAPYVDPAPFDPARFLPSGRHPL